MLGITASEFRRRLPFPTAMTHFVERMIHPYAVIWREFHPLSSAVWERAGERRMATL
jgi:hypothetical protein